MNTIIFLFFYFIILSCNNSSNEVHQRESTEIISKETLNVNYKNSETPCIYEYDTFQDLKLNSLPVKSISQKKFITKFQQYDSTSQGIYYYGKSNVQFDENGSLISFNILDDNLKINLLKFGIQEQIIKNKFPCSYINGTNDHDINDKQISRMRIQLFDIKSNRITIFIDNGKVELIEYLDEDSDFDELN